MESLQSTSESEANVPSAPRNPEVDMALFGALPAPRPDPTQYRRNRFIALALSPRRLLNYIKYKYSERKVDLNYLPVSLDIEPVSRCNFHCTMCQVSDWPKFTRGKDLSVEDFKAIIDEQYGLLEIKLQGLGEPTLGRDKFFEMIAYARKRNIWVRTTTNASLLHLHDNYKKLIDAGINEVQISFDGATKETFESIRRGSKFEKIVENCKLINQYCNERNLLRTRMWVLVQKHNAHEFSDFVRLAAEMGFRRMTYSLDLHGWGMERWEEINEEARMRDQISYDLAKKAIEEGKQLGVEVTFWKATSKYSTASPKTLCQWPFERGYVSSDLRMVPCCTIANPDIFDLGSAKSVSAIWNSESYKEFRRAHLNGEIPKACQECYEVKGSSLKIIR